MRDFLCRLVIDRSGVTAMEYGLIASLIALSIVTVIGTLGSDLSADFQSIASRI